MPDIEYIFLDFDGTIMVYDEEPGFFHPEVIQLLNDLEARGIRWCTNSGRDMKGQWEILEASMQRGLKHMPRALMCCESYIYERQNGHYVPSDPWNREARTYQRDFHRRVQWLLMPQLADWASEYKPIRVYIEDEATVFLVSDGDNRPAVVLERLRELVSRVPDGQVTRNGGWVVALPSQLGKGGILRAYFSTHGIDPDRTLAVGDHLNDLSMLDGSATRFVGCPSDATPQIQKVVARAGGHIASAAGPLGTIEIIKRYT